MLKSRPPFVLSWVLISVEHCAPQTPSQHLLAKNLAWDGKIPTVINIIGRHWLVHLHPDLSVLSPIKNVISLGNWILPYEQMFCLHALSTPPPRQEMAVLSSILAWRIPWTEEPGGLQSMGSQRVGHDWSDLAAAAAPPSVLYSGLSTQHPPHCSTPCRSHPPHSCSEVLSYAVPATINALPSALLHVCVNPTHSRSSRKVLLPPRRPPSLK